MDNDGGIASSLASQLPPVAKIAANPTPPRTPVSPGDASATVPSGPGLCDDGLDAKLTTPRSCPLEFSHDLELQRNECGEPIEYGRGAWSVVRSARSGGVILSIPPGRRTPPGSPKTTNTLLAVKSPLTRTAHSILQGEARLLARLFKTPGNESHLVPFYGFVESSNSIVMAAVPLSLSDHIVDQAAAAQDLSTKTMFDPVLGMSSWLSLAERLVNGLHWLHSSAHVVHGDVKPQNILLRPRHFSAGVNGEDAFPFDPLFIDFTSSHDLLAPNAALKEQGLPLSALTPPFAAPELLTLRSLQSADVAPSKSSDIFSLAVTLLTAVTGDLLLYPSSGHMQLLAMSKDGHRVLDYVRSGPHWSRLPRKGTVEKVLSSAVVKDPDARMSTVDWLDLIRNVKQEVWSTRAS